MRGVKICSPVEAWMGLCGGLRQGRGVAYGSAAKRNGAFDGESRWMG